MAGHVATAVDLCKSVLKEKEADDGHVTVGGVMSTAAPACVTSTVHEQEPTLPGASVARYDMMVRPMLKMELSTAMFNATPFFNSELLTTPTLSVAGSKMKPDVAVVAGAWMVRLTSDGHDTVGASLSTTVTVKVQLPVLPAGSLAVHVMLDCPSEKVVSVDKRVHDTDDTATLSVTVAAATDGCTQLTTPVFARSVVGLTYDDGHTIVGDCRSLMVILKEHCDDKLEVSVAVHTTVVAP